MQRALRDDLEALGLADDEIDFIEDVHYRMICGEYRHQSPRNLR